MPTTPAVNHLAERDASYAYYKNVAAGDTLIALRDIYAYGTVVLRKGQRLTVLAFTNAGFNGITVSGRSASGDHIFGHSAGAFRPARKTATRRPMVGR